jgi:ElaB/YqjD/DUF883 family membrane-anchored ribosome-binding protein
MAARQKSRPLFTQETEMTTNSVQTKDSSTLDLAAIRAEMAALTEQVTALVGAAGKDGAAMVRRVRSKASDTLDDAAEASGQVFQSVGRELTTAQKYATGAVRHHPYQTVALVIGLGALIAFFVRR